MTIKVRKRRRKKRRKLSAEERRRLKVQRDHKAMARSIFRNVGFKRITSLADKELEFEGVKSDFDDVFTYENVIVCIEYTTSASDKVKDHIKPKKIFYDKIENYASAFCKYLCDISQDIEAELTDYQYDELVVRVVYCPLNSITGAIKSQIPYPRYLCYPELRYFKSLTDSIKKSAEHEFFEFLDIEEQDIGRNGKVGAPPTTMHYPGSLLPEVSSNFDKGFKIVSFYIDPAALLRRAYVLRRDGWRGGHNLYQRLISKKKIESLRRYLRDQRRVFVNNIVVTLDEKTKLLNKDGDTVSPSTITKTSPVLIQLPNDVATIGIIDGQHRTFSYYSSVNDDAYIAKLREKQNLLVTGIIYPKGLSDLEKEKFEAQIFLEINSNQTTAKSNLKQQIGLILNPYEAESIATRIVEQLDKGVGVLSGKIERFWFDKDKLKTTSIVSYGLKPLVKVAGDDSLFSLWRKRNSSAPETIKNQSDLANYVDFCVSEIEEFLSAVKSNLSDQAWTAERAVKGRILTTTNINCFLICLRLLIADNKARGFSYYEKKLDGLSAFKFSTYHSSQYARMAEEVFAKYFQ